MQYGAYDCDQIREELLRISDRVGQVSGQQRSARTRDAVAVTVGVLVFWPALFFLMGGDKREELANLKGQYDALEEQAIQKKCPVAEELRGAPSPPPRAVAHAAPETPTAPPPKAALVPSEAASAQATPAATPAGQTTAPVSASQTQKCGVVQMDDGVKLVPCQPARSALK